MNYQFFNKLPEEAKMIREKVEIIYENIVEEGMETYKQLYEETKITDRTIVFWRNAIKLYEKLDSNEKEIFFDIIEQVIIDTTSSIFGILDGSSSIAGGGTLETDIKIDNLDTKQNLQDYFLEIVQQRKDNEKL